MHISSLTKAIRSSLSYIPRCSFSVMDQEYYYKIFQESIPRTTIHERTVKAKTDKRGEYKDIQLYGVPLVPLKASEHNLIETIKKISNEKDYSTLFLQVDPTRYLYSQRRVVSKAEAPQAKTEAFQDLISKDPTHPFTWREAMLHKEVIAKYAEIQQIEDAEIDKKDPEFEKIIEKFGPSAEQFTKEAQKLSETTFEQVLDRKIGRYPEMVNILLCAQLLNNDVVLGGLPKIMRRLILGNVLPLGALRNIFASCCEEANDLIKSNNGILLSDVARLLYPELFYAPEVIYMIIMMKEMALDTGEGFKAFVGTDYIDAIADHWDDPKVSNISFSDIIGMPARQQEDSPDSLIEKHVILDVLLGDSVWDSPYVRNQFPYLTKEENTDATVVDLRKKFYVHSRRYSEVKNKLMDRLNIPKTPNTEQ